MRTFLALAVVLVTTATPAAAGVMVVYDPTNAAQNAATAARMLESLSNQATQLANEARSLSRSPLNQGGDISQSLTSLNTLTRSVTGLTSDLASVERQFDQLFPQGSQSGTRQDLINQGLARLQAARATAQDLARIAADLSSRAGAQQARIQASLVASQGAAGQTAAIQSSTQLMGVLTEQMAGLQTLTAAQARLASEEAARLATDRQAASDAHVRLWAHDPSPPPAPAFDPLSHASR